MRLSRLRQPYQTINTPIILANDKTITVSRNGLTPLLLWYELNCSKREKLEEMGKEEALKNLKKYFGASKRKPSDEELEKVREKVGEEFLKEWKSKKLR